MDAFEKEAFGAGFRLVCGVDEAGRGPLAGPVTAAAVIFSAHLPLDIGIRDSKKLSEKRRTALVPLIHERALALGLGLAWPEEIDEINILNASLRAMERAVGEAFNAARCAKDDFMVLVDGNKRIANLPFKQRTVVSGDALSVSIAAASIIAKTARDSIMLAYDGLYPEYNFASHKGYPTREHVDALLKFGPSPIHRRSFGYPGSGRA
ncbi:MAG: ribonuclease HII [Deltaproteobacteria bacterium]|nr:ribonuclease HII [Deltaproteobacteria bacterium]